MEDITVQELKQRIDAQEKLNIFDVREEHEFDEFNIGATLIPLGELPDRLDEIEQFKDEELIIHCRSGARSGRAKDFLEMQGFTKVRNLLGGMIEWQNQ
ncbi:rhodanese-like domain-containing protein [Sandaracinomonas limnophila]|uniref:Rhodanese-like domain-containing protein n=1 Tax=Sandaracinomonas limnophila TaxID=1862386 RepID=A0A437PR08_9BACT|nr:rhodanese-like domain-containing protein [Sandaracinomonas limnophila]RVU24671.1 rhodanese-like domain-containing protein [Sandaracinomonas limnophila]